MSSRSRGRARGRARGGNEEQARRPGQPPQEHHESIQFAAAEAPAPAPSGGPPASSGRASYRGGATLYERPGAGGEVPADELQKLRVTGTADASKVLQRKGRLRYSEPTTRPANCVDKRGNQGTPLRLATNYFRLEMKPDWHLYQYHVDFNPPVDSKKLRIGLLLSHEELLGKTRAFDGMQLFLPHKLQDEVTEVFSMTKRDNTQIRITITLTAELPSSSPNVIQVYNIIFRRVLAMIDMQQIGRNYYNPHLCVAIPQHKLVVMPGFITSILKYEADILLCADISHKIMRSDRLLEMMYKLYETANKPEDFYDTCTRKFVGSIVMTHYNNKTYRVDDIEWDKRPHHTFKMANGSDITYSDYYKKAYNIDIQDPEQPLIVSRPKKKDIRAGRTEVIYLLPELCTLTGLSDEVRSDFKVMKDVSAHTRIEPEGRSKTLTGFINQINNNPQVQQELRGWGLGFSKELVSLDGRVLPVEKIHQRSGQLSYRQEDADWSRDMRGKDLITPVNLVDWVIVFTQRDRRMAEDLVQTLGRVGAPIGMQITQPTFCQLQNDRTENYLTALKQHVQRSTQLAMCILPSNRKDRYDAIKKFTCVDHPVPSQCVVTRTLSKKQMLMSVATKIAIQLNCKLGGEIWALEIPLKNMMVVGIDTYHDSAKKGRSVGGVIASLNQTLTRYYSRCTFQHSMQELIDELTVCMKGALQKYHDVNGILPERIVVYRDGVGDGQLDVVFEHEVQQLRDCLKKCGGSSYDPKVTFIVVKKRINSRFFARQEVLRNPMPGTVIDNTVTKAIWYDFFLVSQSVRQGTVTPTHYNVIFDTAGLRPDHMQRLTYKMTHLYYNWPGTIRVPAPCQYAHKLAFLVGQSIHKSPALELSDRLYFL